MGEWRNWSKVRRRKTKLWENTEGDVGNGRSRESVMGERGGEQRGRETRE